jgi:hypothetical protein
MWQLQSCPKPEGGCWRPGDTWWPGAALSQEADARAAGTRGAPGAALCREAGAGAQATHGSPRAALSREVGVGAAGTRGVPGSTLTFVLTWSLYAWVPDPQGIDSMSSMHKNPSNRWHLHSYAGGVGQVRAPPSLRVLSHSCIRCELTRDSGDGYQASHYLPHHQLGEALWGTTLRFVYLDPWVSYDFWILHAG